MTDSERRDYFLVLFKKLEKTLVSLSNIKSDEYVSFSRALNKIYYDKLEPTIADYENYSFLRSASDLRNLLSHEIDTCIPTEAFVRRTENILETLTHPLCVYDLCTKEVEYCLVDDSLSSVMKRMNQLSLSHFPIYSDGKITGVFSRSTLFDANILHIAYDENSKISDFSKVTGLSNHLNETFLFVSKRTTVDKVFSYLSKREAHKKNVACLFVTEHGVKEEKILGVCTLTDLTGRKDK